ncbi:MAG: MgtC/SapB family protein [Leadbetterella sp.]
MENFEFYSEDIIKLLISAGTGAFIGYEREYHSKSAGLRTMILICLGATLFTIISIKLGSDPARIAANIVTGIGFIGGGIIYRDSENSRITGITTAAAVWVTAALGMCVGFGSSLYSTGFIAMILVMITLYSLVYVQDYIKKNNQSRHYQIKGNFAYDDLKKFEVLFKSIGLYAKKGSHSKSKGLVVGNWHIQGSEKRHDKLIEKLLNDPEVIELDF